VSRVLLIALLVSWVACNVPGQAIGAELPRRIVSLAPSVTETLFALGFGDRLAGVTTYCDYPAEARKLPKIGDFMNPSLEAVVAKRPDLVIGVAGVTDPVKAREMERLGLKVVLVSVSNLSDILAAVFVNFCFKKFIYRPYSIYLPLLIFKCKRGPIPFPVRYCFLKNRFDKR